MVGGHIDVDEYGTPIIGDHLLILFNADHATEIPFALPKLKDAGPWERLFDTARDVIDVEVPKAEGKELSTDDPYKLAACSMVVLRAAVPKEADPLTAT
jgi:glycogen operon protein